MRTHAPHRPPSLPKLTQPLEAILAASQSRPLLVHIVGPSGTGKSTLLRSLRDSLQGTRAFGFTADGFETWPSAADLDELASHDDGPLLLDSADYFARQERLDPLWATIQKSKGMLCVATMRADDWCGLFEQPAQALVVHLVREPSTA